MLAVFFNLSAKELGGVSGVVSLPEGKAVPIPIAKYRGKISGKVSSAPAVIAAVWLESDKISAPKASLTVTLTQTNYQFSEHLIVIPKGSTLLFPNNDPDYHNIYSLSKTKRFDLGRYKSNEKPIPRVTFDKAGYVRLLCEIHDHMNANVIVVDSPYYGTTDASGRFKIENVPAGDYTLHAQVDRKTAWKMAVKIEDSKIVKVNFPK